MTRIYIEGTMVQQQYFDHVTGEIPIVVHDGGDGMTPDMLTRYPIGDRMHDDDPYPAKPVAKVGAAAHEVRTLSEFESAMGVIDANPIVAACDLENPESCESCS